MKVKQGLESLQSLPAGSVLSIGNFDGVHVGHVAILNRATELATRPHRGSVVVVTFEPHPLTVLRPDDAPPRLTPVRTKERLLADAGVDELVILPPTPEVLSLTAERFWDILRDVAKPRHVVEGVDFTFGKARHGTVARLQEWCDATAGAVALHVVPDRTVVLCDLTLVPVSSTLIRFLVTSGRVRDAAVALGRPYAIEGRVEVGYQRGRTIGVPTANLRADQQLVPGDGVYVGRCDVAGVTYPAAVSIGTMVTFGSENRRQIEAHLIGFTGDLYGHDLRVELVDWLRDQRKFAGVDALKSQLARDVESARRTCVRIENAHV